MISSSFNLISDQLYYESPRKMRQCGRSAAVARHAGFNPDLADAPRHVRDVVSTLVTPSSENLTRETTGERP